MVTRKKTKIVTFSIISIQCVIFLYIIKIDLCLGCQTEWLNMPHPIKTFSECFI